MFRIGLREVQHGCHCSEHPRDVLSARAACCQPGVVLSQQLECPVHGDLALNFDARGFAKCQHVPVQRGMDPVNGTRRPVRADQFVGIGKCPDDHVSGVLGGIQADCGGRF